MVSTLARPTTRDSVSHGNGSLRAPGDSRLRPTLLDHLDSPSRWRPVQVAAICVAVIIFVFGLGYHFGTTQSHKEKPLNKRLKARSYAITADAVINPQNGLVNHDLAGEYLEEAIAIDPHCSHAWLSKGVLHEKDEEPRQAAECYHNAILFARNDDEKKAASIRMKRLVKE